jgi:hypothetical protein
MYLLFIWGGTYGFGWGEIHNKGRLKGLQTAPEMVFLPPAPIKKTGTLVILWIRKYQGPFRDGSL